MPGVDVTRARRWFWGLVLAAVVASGGLYWAVGAPAGPVAGLVLFVSGLVAAASILQAARVLRALNGPLDLSLDLDPPPWTRGQRSRTVAAAHETAGRAGSAAGRRRV